MIKTDDLFQTLSQTAKTRGIHYDLNTFKAFLTNLGNPEQQLKNVIHIAGTNGKGSTLSFIASALMSNGYKVGTYTSPHLIDYCERIQLNQKWISKTDFIHIFTLGCHLLSSIKSCK